MSKQGSGMRFKNRPAVRARVIQERVKPTVPQQTQARKASKPLPTRKPLLSPARQTEEQITKSESEIETTESETSS